MIKPTEPGKADQHATARSARTARLHPDDASELENHIAAIAQTTYGVVPIPIVASKPVAAATQAHLPSECAEAKSP